MPHPGRRRTRHGRPPARGGGARGRPFRQLARSSSWPRSRVRRTTGWRSRPTWTPGTRLRWPCPARTTRATRTSICGSASWPLSVDRDARTVTTASGCTSALRRAGAGHRLAAVRAAGARPRPARLLRLPDHRGPRRDPRGGRRQAGHAGRRSAVVIGGGLLGLEAAKALRDMGLSPHVVEMAPRLMPLQVDEGGGSLLRRLISELDVTVHTGTSTDAIEADGSRLLAKLGNGTELDVDLVVFSAGVRPRDDLARRVRPGRSARAAASSSTNGPAAPATRRSTRSASARLSRAGCTASWRPATRWPRSSPRSSPAAPGRSRSRTRPRS